MKILKLISFNVILTLSPYPARLGWQLACLGDFILERSGGAAMEALRGLAVLEESEAA